MLAADIFAIVVVGLYEAAADDSIFAPSLPESGVLCAIGVGLVALRVVALALMSQIPQRVWGWIKISLGGGDQAQKRALKDKNADSRDSNARQAFDLAPLYWGSVSVGLLGYSILVTITGGPFNSPLAPLMLAGFFLGQIRATTKLNIGVLLAAGVVAVVASWGLEEAEPDLGFVRVLGGLTYAGRVYLPAAFVVAIVTTVVNVATFVEEAVNQPGTDPTSQPGPDSDAGPVIEPLAKQHERDGVDGTNMST